MSIHKVLCLLHFMASKAQNYPIMISTGALLVSHSQIIVLPSVVQVEEM